MFVNLPLSLFSLEARRELAATDFVAYAVDIMESEHTVDDTLVPELRDVHYFLLDGQTHVHGSVPEGQDLDMASTDVTV